MVSRGGDDPLQIAGPRCAGFDAVIDVHPGLGGPVVGVHDDPVATVAQGHALDAIQRREVLLADLPQHAVDQGAVERFDCGDPALVDEPVVVRERSGARIDGVGAASRHLRHAEVGAVREVARHSAVTVR